MPPRLAPEARGEGRLLLAEDNAVNRKLAVAILSVAGYRVDTVSDGALAVEAAAARRYDAILMDCQMPEMSGYEATAAIRSLEGPDRHTPIIALTAGAMHEDRDRALAEGMDAHLSKPINKDALLALVARCLREATMVSTPTIDAIAVDEASLDPSAIQELRALGLSSGTDLLTEMVDLFADNIDPLIAQLRESLTVGDAPAVGRIAHKMRGSCAQLGGRRLEASFGRLEQIAASGDISNDHSLLHDVELEYGEFRGALDRELTPRVATEPVLHRG